MDMTAEEYDTLRRSIPYQLALAAGMAALTASHAVRVREVAELERLFRMSDRGGAPGSDAK